MLFFKNFIPLYVNLKSYLASFPTLFHPPHLPFTPPSSPLLLIFIPSTPFHSPHPNSPPFITHYSVFIPFLPLILYLLPSPHFSLSSTTISPHFSLPFFIHYPFSCPHSSLLLLLFSSPSTPFCTPTLSFLPLLFILQLFFLSSTPPFRPSLILIIHSVPFSALCLSRSDSRTCKTKRRLRCKSPEIRWRGCDTGRKIPPDLSEPDS